MLTPSAAPTPSPSPAPAPATAEIAFADRNLGWAVGQLCGEPGANGKWFLISPAGEILERFYPRLQPDAPRIAELIEANLPFSSRLPNRRAA